MTEAELATQKMLTRLAEDVASLKAIVEQTHKDLHGNGQPGIITRVAGLERDTDPLRGKTSLTERVTRLETKVGVVAALAGLLASAVVETVKLFL